jgi:hypothetical protein
MKKTFIIPQHDVEITVNAISINLSEDVASTSLSMRDILTDETSNINPVTMTISSIFNDAITKGDITTANVNAFEKCWKLLAVRAMKKELSDL